MDLSRAAEFQYRMTHRHKDGAWGEMVEVPMHHGAAAHDPERRWGFGRLFKCTSCEEWAVITKSDADGRPVDD